MEMFPISPKFASKDKVESFLVLLSCLVMLRHNLLGLLWSSASKWYCSLGGKKRYKKVTSKVGQLGWINTSGLTL